jgi:hypothetical protein
MKLYRGADVARFLTRLLGLTLLILMVLVAWKLMAKGAGRFA